MRAYMDTMQTCMQIKRVFFLSETVVCFIESYNNHLVFLLIHCCLEIVISAKPVCH